MMWWTKKSHVDLSLKHKSQIKAQSWPKLSLGTHIVGVLMLPWKWDVRLPYSNLLSPGLTDWPSIVADKADSVNISLPHNPGESRLEYGSAF